MSDSAPKNETSPHTLSARLAGWGSIFVASGIALGAFGAHGLKNAVTPEVLAVFEKAVFYQLLNGVALVFLPFVPALLGRASKGIVRGWWIIGLGILLFSGSLYAYVLSGVRTFALITPLGGSLFIVGWLAIALALLAGSPPRDQHVRGAPIE